MNRFSWHSRMSGRKSAGELPFRMQWLFVQNTSPICTGQRFNPESRCILAPGVAAGPGEARPHHWPRVLGTELYADLLVRVAGYSDYFVHLNRAMQAEVIARTEHELG